MNGEDKVVLHFLQCGQHRLLIGCHDGIGAGTLIAGVALLLIL